MNKEWAPLSERSDLILKILFVPLTLTLIWHFSSGKIDLIKSHTPISSFLYALFFVFIMENQRLWKQMHLIPFRQKEIFSSFLHLLFSVFMSTIYLIYIKRSAPLGQASSLQMFFEQLDFSTCSLLILISCPFLTLILSESYAPSWGYFNASLLGSIIISFAWSDLSLFPIFLIGIFSALKLSQRVSPYLTVFIHSAFYVLTFFIYRIFL